MKDPSKQSRRDFLKTSAVASTAATAASFPLGLSAQGANRWQTVDTFERADSLYHGSQWETLNPGYWQVKNGALRRRLKNVGERARRTGFPYHYQTHQNKPMPVEYDPSLPEGVLWNRAWKLTGNYRIKITGRYIAARPELAEDSRDNPAWQMHQDGYGHFGLVTGGKNLLEGYDRLSNGLLHVWQDSGKLHQVAKGKGKRNKGANAPNPNKPTTSKAALAPGDIFDMQVRVSGNLKGLANIEFQLNDHKQTREKVPRRQTDGYFGIIARGGIDFEILDISIAVEPDEDNATISARDVGHCDCYTAYALGDTLTQNEDGDWTVRFVCLFASDGETAEIRMSDSEQARWELTDVAGSAKIVTNDYRSNTAILTATLPRNPADATLYYTIWKDGVDVTPDLRIGSAGSGPGTGFVGDVPNRADYVGRLPRLQAPYRIAGMSCHAITSGLQSLESKKMLGGADDWKVRDQPTEGAYRYFEDFNFQICLWEDDVWYMELYIYPPSTDDAYKIVTTSICGPTSRWQMMRHWNVINPGDHDYGMDDVKGPEQIAIRTRDNLGQDPEYMRRNFQIVDHLTTGNEAADPLENPKKWRAWKMPNRDFTFVVCDGRLWRSSQDTNIWADWGWGEAGGAPLYDRTDPTRTLLGEEQFAWLQETIKTDSSPLICMTGINALHTVWTGVKLDERTGFKFADEDRVAADYAGWVKAGADRVIELLGSREGVVSVYGDVHVGCLMKNTEHRVLESSFGPIGRSGGRSVIKGFGREMKDVDGRDLEVLALYHNKYKNPDLEPIDKFPVNWNILAAEFDPRGSDPQIRMTLRNLIDQPADEPRGGGVVENSAAQTGRKPTCLLPIVNTLPDADVRLATLDGRPVRGVRSLGDGTLPLRGLPDIKPGTKILLTATAGSEADAQIVVTKSV